MEIKIGNLLFGGESKYQIEPGVQGLGSADIRVGDGLYAGMDGGFVSTHLYGMRTIVFTGFYLAANCQETESLRLGLLSSLHIRTLYPIMIKMFNGGYYYTEGYLTNVKAEISGPRANEFQLTFLCPDPYIYDGRDGQDPVYAYTIYKTSTGGFDLAYSTPVTWVNGNLVTIVNNPGSVDTYPVITLTGVCTTPTITNQTTGKTMVVSRTTAANHRLVIDMKKRIIVDVAQNGTKTPVQSYRSTSSSWWTLAPGDNQIYFNTTSGSDTNYGMIEFKAGFEGI